MKTNKISGYIIEFHDNSPSGSSVAFCGKNTKGKPCSSGAAHSGLIVSQAYRFFSLKEAKGWVSGEQWLVDRGGYSIYPVIDMGNEDDVRGKSVYDVEEKPRRMIMKRAPKLSTLSETDRDVIREMIRSEISKAWYDQYINS